ncbi:SDR family NAD(P)-dependent oxidoreductase [Amycolatopsis japonica]|uniref:SDR family NAD(P)-dependent oxidoreductase n=1 Tax=Amycolatopsis japonica TaxID=208439 RepID=UPI003671BA05
MSASPNPDPATPIAVVGVSALLPGPPGAGGFWRTVFLGEDQVVDVPETHWLLQDHYDPDPKAPDKCYSKRGGFLSPVPFDPLRLGIPPAILPAIDTSQLLTLLAAEQLLDAIGALKSTVDTEGTSVIIGSSPMEMLETMSSRLQRPVWLKALREKGVPEPEAQDICDRIAAHYVPWQEASLPGMLSNVVAGRIANRFDLHGTNYTTDAACASSLAALRSGANELALGQSDLVITGGVDTLNDPLIYTSFSKTPALSPTNDCRPFSSDSDGMVLGEGVVLFALRRLSDAERDGNPVFAVIRGVGAASDGRGGAIYAPQPSGQVRALRRAYDAAGYSPDTVELIEAHGTGTAAGDAAETAALREVFTATGRADAAWCALGSVKSQIGHTKSAAGAAGLLKAVLAVHHGVLPPTLKVDRPNPKLKIDDSPFYLSTRSRPWINDGTHPRRAGVSSFGFGGTNFHIAVEEHVPSKAAKQTSRMRASRTELVLLAGPTPQAVCAAAERIAAKPGSLSTVARDSQREFDHLAPVRLAVVVTDADHLVTTLRAAVARIRANPVEPFTGTGGIYSATAADPGPIAFLFPGQGSQYVGMGAEIVMHLPEALSSWDAVAAVPCGGEPLHRVVFPPPAFTDEDRTAQNTRLTRTEWAQPALAAHSLALLEVLRLLDVRPDAVGGHSFGELVALHTAGCFDRETLLRLARTRGEAMRDAATVAGAMTAVLASADEVRALVAEVADNDLWVANHNTPRQVVVAGSVDAVSRLEERAGAAGHKVRRLATSAAFHTPLVGAAESTLRDALAAETMAAPTIPVYRNTSATPYEADVAVVRTGLAEQLTSPVLFAEQVEAMHDAGIRTFLEVGANATLTGLVTDILSGRDHLAVALDRERTDGVRTFHEALARLAVAGVRLNFAALWTAYPPDAEETMMDAHSAGNAAVDLLGTNYGKPYPPPGGSNALPPPNPVPPPPPAPAPAAVLPPASFTTAPAGPDMVAQAANGHPAQGDWLAVVAETQRLASAAHATFQQITGDSHVAFLRLAEAALLRLGGETPAIHQEHPSQAVHAAPAALPMPSPPSPVAPTPIHAPIPAPAPPVSQVPVPAPVSPVFAAVSSTVLAQSGTEVVLEVVAEKTGYPVDVLSVGMDLESDLGIDSIKRVEVLSAIQERVIVPDVDPAVWGTVRTLGEIADVLGSAEVAEPAPAPLPVPLVPAPRVTYSESSPAAPTPSEVDVVLEVVAEKTGYPVDVLNVGMDLESDLGIDSIKRVEVLSAIQDRVIVPDVDPAVWGTVRTLGQIAEVLGSAPIAAEPAAGGSTRRFVSRQVSAPACGLETPGLMDGTLAVVGGPGPVADALVARLTDRGVSARIAEDIGDDLSAVVYLGGLADGEEDVNRSAILLAKAFAAARTEKPGLFAVVQDSRQPSPNGLTALARTAAQEWPDVVVRTIDCDTALQGAAQIADLIAAELADGGSTPEVTLSSAGRTVVTFEELITAPSGSDRIGPDSVLVVSGGGHGITAIAIRALAVERTPKAVLLLGRSVLDDEPAYLHGATDADAVRQAVIDHLRSTGKTTEPREIRAMTVSALALREVRETIRTLESAGCTTFYRSVDITDPAAVQTAVKAFRAEAGPITGVIHGAGVLADKTIVDKPIEDYERVVATKVDGLRALLDATADDPLDVLCVFSSVSAEFGNAGQSDYAIANEVVTRLADAERVRRPECLVRTIAWGPWTAGMVDDSLAAHFRAKGVELISEADGAHAFLEELHEDTRLGSGAVIRSAGPPPAGDGVSGEVVLSTRRHPHLNDHAIAGVPVVPVALALEWCTGAAVASFPGKRVAVTGLEVLSKIALDGQESTRLSLTSGPLEGDTCSMTLTGPSGRPHYRATLATAGPPTAAWPPPLGLPPLDRVVYDGHLLFHGPAFHALEAVDGLDGSGAVGRLLGVRQLGWPDRPRHTDPAAVDGCMQLAAAWSAYMLGGAVLPMGVGSFQVFEPGPVNGPAVAVVRAGRRANDVTAFCSIQASTPGGGPLFELTDVRLVLRPDTATVALPER